ncbi:MAG: lipopolysaccharide heptosyltransferase II [Nitrospirota bacterium]
MSGNTASSILVRGVNWIGDAVMTMPALWSVRKAFPDAPISLLVKPSVAPVFERDPAVDEIILYEDCFRTAFGRFKLAYRLRKKHFSKAILLQNAFDAALLAFLAGIPERIGYDRDRRGFLLTHPVSFNGEDRKIHHIAYYLTLLKAVGMPVFYQQPWIRLSLDERRTARERLAALPRPILGINPGAAYGSAKRWLPQRFAEVAQWFIKDRGGGVVIFGGPKEAATAEEIEKLIGSEASGVGHRALLSLSGRTTVRELISLIAACDVLVTNDSGPMHLGYAVGTPLVTIFGSTSPQLTGPVGYGNRIVRKGFSCGPCFERTCDTGDLRCMYTITSEEVFFTVKELLPKRPAVFFDRDGTLCRDAHYLKRWEDFELLPGVERLGVLKDAGFALIGVSNQSGVSRGIVNEAFVKEVNRMFTEEFGFDAFYYCSHGPDDYCSCRKPEPGMLVRARAEHGIDLQRSYLVGDKDDDMLTAKAAGATAILVTTGKQQSSAHADITVNSLDEAVRVILRNEDGRD